MKIEWLHFHLCSLILICFIFFAAKNTRNKRKTINLEFGDCGVYVRRNREISDCIVCSVHVAANSEKTVKTKAKIMDMFEKKSVNTVVALRALKVQ